jgi:hypothetical protein
VAVPVSPTTGQIITKKFWDTEITDRWNDFYAPWTAYTPAWTATTTNPVLGNGSLVAAYKRADEASRLVYLRLRLVAGSSTSFGTGFWRFSLPTGTVLSLIQTIHGFVGNDTGTNRYPVAAYLTTSNGIEQIGVNGSTGVTNTAPFAWASGYQLVLGGVFQVA